ncbi:mitogen-activated protein kinase kinase kinase 20 [Manihot esculenta]|uniref:mitogen-activated protein kinase kinase kinase 20 n=1 Tax=Manihot esculenta TaxID=3983 RepID=UPI000B5D263F|nr:mitogen-activated protein kinase kinase kinase 20 [Manihot esculenta]
MKRKFVAVEEDSLDNHGVAWWRGPLLGKGGSGSVYLAYLKKPKSRNAFYRRVMAVKSAEFSSSSSLQKEKEVFNHLHDCPYILECYGEETTVSKNGQMVYNLLLEYASGGTLADLIRRSGGCGLPESDVKKYTRFILKGIDYIHSHNYVHRDLKPENVLLVPCGSGDFVPKIADFGLAKKVQNTKRRMFDSSIAGTILYMAPETLVHNVQESGSDIWALGCIVYEMFTGKPLWGLNPDESTEELCKRIADRLELPDVPSGISKDGSDFLKGCLVKNHKFRFSVEMLLNHPFVSGIDDTASRVQGSSTLNLSITDKGIEDVVFILANEAGLEAILLARVMKANATEASKPGLANSILTNYLLKEIGRHAAAAPPHPISFGPASLAVAAAASPQSRWCLAAAALLL